MIKNKSGYYQEDVLLTTSQIDQLQEINDLVFQQPQGTSSLMAQVIPETGEIAVIFLPSEIAENVQKALRSLKEGEK